MISNVRSVLVYLLAIIFIPFNQNESLDDQFNAIALLHRESLSLSESAFNLFSKEMSFCFPNEINCCCTDSNLGIFTKSINISSIGYLRDLNSIPELDNCYLDFEIDYLNDSVAVKSRLCGHYIHTTCYKVMHTI